MIDDVQRRALGASAAEGPGTEMVSGVESRTCGWRNYDTGYGYNFQTIPLDASAAMSEPGSRIQTIRGFGAVENSPDEVTGGGIPPFCQLTIDVNDGQAVRVQVQSTNTAASGNSSALEETCQRARRFAGDVVTTLMSQQL